MLLVKKFTNFCPQLGKLHSSGSPCTCPTDEWALFFWLGQRSTCPLFLHCISKGAPRILFIVSGYSEWLGRLSSLRGSSSYSRLPITDGLTMITLKSLDTSVRDHCLLWAVCNLGYWQVSKLKFLSANKGFKITALVLDCVTFVSFLTLMKVRLLKWYLLNVEEQVICKLLTYYCQ